MLPQAPPRPPVVEAAVGEVKTMFNLMGQELALRLRAAVGLASAEAQRLHHELHARRGQE